MYILGEAYAFGIVWSFAFKAMAMVVLRFKDRSPREFKVPLNIRIRGVEVPIGLSIIFLILISSAVLNTLTKEVATIGGSIFTAVFLAIFMGSEYYHERRRGKAAHQHLEQFNRRAAEELDPAVLGLDKPYRKLVAIRSSQNLFMLEKALFETDPETTDVVVMTAKPVTLGNMTVSNRDFDYYDRELMTAVVNRAETIGKEVKPLIMPTNNPLFAIVNTAKILQAQELILGASNKYTADEQLEQIAFYWMNVEAGEMAPLTVRMLSRQRDVYLDLGGGNRIPKISERQARSVEELRSAGRGRKPRAVGPCRHGRGERPVQGGHHHARPPRRAERGSASAAADERGRPRKPPPGFSRTLSVPSNSSASWTSRRCPPATRPRQSSSWPASSSTTW